jgi:hypothetical protein
MRIVRLLAFLGIVVALGCVSHYAIAQEDKRDEKLQQPSRDESAGLRKAVNAYRLDFVLSELVDGKKVNTRSYSVVAREGKMNKLRSGARYPLATGTQLNNTQFQYIDIGVNIDCEIDAQDGTLELNATIDSSSVSWPDAGSAHSAPGQPVISQMRSEIRTFIRPGVPTMVSSMEDPASKRRFQVDVTAAKVN